MRYLIALFTLCIVTSAARPAAAQVPHFTHVFVIVMENQEYEQIIGNPSAPYINSLAQRYGLATADFAVTHPSLPNYMALTGGATVFTDDCQGCTTPGANLADRIEASGRTWTAYMEDMPAACTATDAGLYTARHDPFVHYDDIVGNAARCARGVVPFSRFGADLAANTLASFVWITPNLCHDMHDCSASDGDAWLRSIVPQILASPAFNNSALFLAWDEGTTSADGGGHVPLIVASPATPPGTRVGQPATDYSLLRTIEDAWGLSPLGQSAQASALAGFFPGEAAPAVDEVVYASDVSASSLHGNWALVPDPTAAGGMKLATPDKGLAFTAAPLPAPANYVDVTFAADAGTPYAFWLRARALNDSKWNDSAWIQFSDALAGGTPAYPIGSSSALLVNLATDSSAASLHGWGWQKGAYWLSQATTVTFAHGGTHTVRLQVREDGMQIDQIVLSRGRYLTSAPGGVTNDQTIVPKPAATGDVVIHASGLGAGALHGNWSAAPDATSPSGVKIISADKGAAATAHPLASPIDYVDATFTASAGTAYTLWMRLQATGNSKWSDSLWVQFSDARAAGDAAYPIGTTSGLLVNLATDAAAGSLNRWGWQNGAYWLSQPASFTFAASGTHTMRIQIREDGVQFDQIVLSPSTYLSRAPGPVGGDQTIVPQP